MAQDFDEMLASAANAWKRKAARLRDDATEQRGFAGDAGMSSIGRPGDHDRACEKKAAALDEHADRLERRIAAASEGWLLFDSVGDANESMTDPNWLGLMASAVKANGVLRSEELGTETES